MAEVEFSNAAEADLADIDEFSASRFGEEVGEAYMHGFTKAFIRLAEFPQSGRSTPDYGRDIRCLSQASHRIFYRMNGNRVLVLRVLHHAQDARRHLEE